MSDAVRAMETCAGRASGAMRLLLVLGILPGRSLAPAYTRARLHRRGPLLRGRGLGEGRRADVPEVPQREGRCVGQQALARESEGSERPRTAMVAAQREGVRDPGARRRKATSPLLLAKVAGRARSWRRERAVAGFDRVQHPGAFVRGTERPAGAGPHEEPSTEANPALLRRRGMLTTAGCSAASRCRWPAGCRPPPRLAAVDQGGLDGDRRSSTRS